MSTISTHLNWGSSYVVHDFYQRFVKPDASNKELVLVGRLSTLALMVIGGVFALTFLENATQAFNILLLSGAGTGSIFLLRWFWWRINATTEIVAIIVATVNAFVLVLLVSDEQLQSAYLDAFTLRLLIASGITTVAWLLTVFLTQPESKDKLQAFVQHVNPEAGWKSFGSAPTSKFSLQLISVFVGTIGVYAALFSIGNLVYGNLIWGVGMLILFVLSAWTLIRIGKIT